MRQDIPITQTGTDAKHQSKDETRCAYAMLDNQDWNVSRVLRKLDELKLSENSIVLYFSDHSPNGNRWPGGFKGTLRTARLESCAPST